MNHELERKLVRAMGKVVIPDDIPPSKKITDYPCLVQRAVDKHAIYQANGDNLIINLTRTFCYDVVLTATFELTPDEDAAGVVYGIINYMQKIERGGHIADMANWMAEVGLINRFHKTMALKNVGEFIPLNDSEVDKLVKLVQGIATPYPGVKFTLTYEVMRYSRRFLIVITPEGASIGVKENLDDRFK